MLLPGKEAEGKGYLNQDAIVQAALDTGAQAILPGYGFLSENASFASKVEQAGLVFAGPTPTSIKELGLKFHARELAEHPSHLVVLVGTRAPSSAPKGGIFARYQLLTPTIILVGLVALGVLVPLLLFGVSAIATIQSPLRSESFKPVSAQKKNQ